MSSRRESRPGACLLLVCALVATSASGLSAQARKTNAQPAAAGAPAEVTRPAPGGRLTQFLDESFFGGMRYRMVGPARGGRVTTVTGVRQQPLTFYMGSTGGGIWKTADAGETWTNVTDGFLDVGSMGDIDVADSDPNVIYAGTGSDDIRSNVSIGRGVWKSTDAGVTWRRIGLHDVGNIGAVRVSPDNPNVAYVAAIGNPFAPGIDRGVYRTTDGGNSWKKVLYVSDSTGAVDLELQPGQPATVFASMWRAERKPWTIISGAREGGVYKSTDGGETWRPLTNGLPTDLVGKSNIAVTPADPQVVYVLIEAKPGSGLYRSDDAGESFRLVSDYPPLLTRPFYYTSITVNPRDANTVWVGTEGLYKSTDGGRTWQVQRNPHGDNHDLWMNPDVPDLMIQANDGGATVSLNGGRTWSTEYNQPTAEIYQVAVDSQFPYRLYGAQQDNTTLIVPSRPLSSGSIDDPIQSWRVGPGCETGPILPHPTNPDTVYGACKGQFSRLSLRSGQEKQYWIGAQSLYGNAGKDLTYRFQRVSPMEISPHDPRVIYYGSQYVHRTRDEGVTWERISPDLTWNPPERQQSPSGEPITIDVTGEEYYSVLYAIRESPLEPGLIWTGANDGPFHVTRDGGKTWADVTPKAQPPGCRVQNIEPSPHRRGSAYYAVLCYLLGDFHPYLWRTDDYGATWTLLTSGANGIPADEPTRVVREDPGHEGLLYAGTEFGVYVSFDNGATWRTLQLNLPHTPVTDMRVYRGDLVLATQGRSFWILDDIEPLHEISDAIARSAAHLFTPRDAWRFRYALTYGVEGNRHTPADPEYPPPGAPIDYWLSPDAAGAPVTLEILDAGGRVLRVFSSGDAGARAQESSQPGAPLPDMVSIGTPRLPHEAGINRFTWDLRLPGPWDTNVLRSGRDGPLVVPGAYRVRLTSGAYRAEQPLTVRIDPRVARDDVTLADLREQLAHNQRVRDLVSEVNQSVWRVEAARRRLVGATGAAADTLARLDSLRATLETPPVRYSRPGLQAHIEYLYGLTTAADQKIGRDAVERYRTLRASMDAVRRDVDALLGAPLRPASGPSPGGPR